MNYIRQIQAFNDRMLTKPLSSGQISLWYALMFINNKTAWATWFTVANRTLESQSGLSRSGIQKARNQLRQSGYIEFNANGTKATSYHLIDLAMAYSTQDSTQVSTQAEPTRSDSAQASTQTSTQDGGQVSTQDRDTLNKQNKTKQNKTSDHDGQPAVDPIPDDQATADRMRVFDAYERSWGFMAPLTQEELRDWLETFPADMVVEAIKRAVGNQAKWSYANAILRDWDFKKIYTMADVQKADTMHNAGRFNKRRTAEPKKTKQPAWADPNYKSSPAKPTDPATKAKLAAEMAKLRANREKRKESTR